MTVRERFDRVWPSLVALLGTVAVVAGLLVLFGGDVEPSGPDDDPAAQGTDGATPAPTDAATSAPETPAAPVTAPPELREDVAILNGTDVTGLAARAQEQLEAGGWTVPAIDTYTGDIAETTIFYPEGMEESAQALAAQFPVITQVSPTIAGLTTQRLVLIVAEDYAEAVGTTG